MESKSIGIKEAVLMSPCFETLNLLPPSFPTLSSLLILSSSPK